jgi:N-acetylmuramoyl-L-alanine amidase
MDIEYFLKVNVCLSVFYLIYLLVFQRTTFFVLNRFYLLAGLAFSFLIPLLQVPIMQESDLYQFPLNTPLTAILTSAHNYDATVSVPVTSHVEEISFLPLIYYTGMVVMLLRFLYSILAISKIINRSEVIWMNEVKIFRARISQPFTFCDMIFVPEYDIDRSIIEHEKSHVKQQHWIDLAFVEIALIFMWFNPLIYFYKRSVKTQHEYLADSSAINSGIAVEQYLSVMLRQIQLQNIFGPVNNFYSQSIKNRINMITRNKTSFKFYLMYLILAPVALLLLLAFATTGEDTREASFKTEFLVIVDPGHGGEDAGAKASGGVSEKELTLAIAKKIQKSAEANGIKIILTRSGDETAPFKDRVSFAERFAADLFISLHVNFNADDPLKSGIDCAVSDKNVNAGQSKLFADQLTRDLKTIGGIGVNGVTRTDAYVLKNNGATAVAIELGYLSNTSDRAFITNETNQEVIARKIVASMTNFLK